MKYITLQVRTIADALRQNAAGVKQATMTDMDLAAEMLTSLAAERDELARQASRAEIHLADALELLEDIRGRSALMGGESSLEEWIDEVIGN